VEQLQHVEKDQFFQLYHDENKLHSMRKWWCALCTRPKCLVGILQC